MNLAELGDSQGGLVAGPDAVVVAAPAALISVLQFPRGEGWLKPISCRSQQDSLAQCLQRQRPVRTAGHVGWGEAFPHQCWARAFVSLCGCSVSIGVSPRALSSVFPACTRVTVCECVSMCVCACSHLCVNTLVPLHVCSWLCCPVTGILPSGCFAGREHLQHPHAGGHQPCPGHGDLS